MPKRGFGSAPTGVCQRRSSMDHRVKPGGDDSEQWLCHSSDAQAHRENEISISSLPDLIRQSTRPGRSLDQRLPMRRDSVKPGGDEVKRPSKDAAEVPGPSSFEARFRSHLRMTENTLRCARDTN